MIKQLALGKMGSKKPPLLHIEMGIRIRKGRLEMFPDIVIQLRFNAKIFPPPGVGIVDIIHDIGITFQVNIAAGANPEIEMQKILVKRDIIIYLFLFTGVERNNGLEGHFKIHIHFYFPLQQMSAVVFYLEQIAADIDTGEKRIFSAPKDIITTHKAFPVVNPGDEPQVGAKIGTKIFIAKVPTVSAGVSPEGKIHRVTVHPLLFLHEFPGGSGRVKGRGPQDLETDGIGLADPYQPVCTGQPIVIVFALPVCKEDAYSGRGADIPAVANNPHRGALVQCRVFRTFGAGKKKAGYLIPA
jgi:hypothetical protein